MKPKLSRIVVLILFSLFFTSIAYADLLFDPEIPIVPDGAIIIDGSLEDWEGV